MKPAQARGHVWLSGTVRYGVERDAAEQAVAGLTGVRSIKRHRGVQRRRSGRRFLPGAGRSRPALADPGRQRLEVSASDGTITLTGHVRDWAEHDAVMRAAWNGLGVTAVRDDLVITG